MLNGAGARLIQASVIRKTKRNYEVLLETAGCLMESVRSVKLRFGPRREGLFEAPAGGALSSGARLLREPWMNGGFKILAHPVPPLEPPRSDALYSWPSFRGQGGSVVDQFIRP